MEVLSKCIYLAILISACNSENDREKLEKNLTKGSYKYPCRIPDTILQANLDPQRFLYCVHDFNTNFTLNLHIWYCDEKIDKVIQLTVANQQNKADRSCTNIKVSGHGVYTYKTVYFIRVAPVPIPGPVGTNLKAKFQEYINISTANYLFQLKCNHNPCLVNVTKLHDGKSSLSKKIHFFLENTICLDGYWGKHCQKYCHCVDGAVCERRTGVCLVNCSKRFAVTPFCNQTCPANKWGITSSNTIGQCQKNCYCFNPRECDVSLGFCHDGLCIKNYQPDPATKLCEKCLFGKNCGKQCHCLDNAPCDPGTGKCPNGTCHPRFHGVACQDTCPDGKYLINETCQGVCNCKKNVVCDIEDGKCHTTACADGYEGTDCKQCERGYFGQGCARDCYCKHKEICHHIYGNCSRGCDDTHYGVSCQNICPHGTYLDLESFECTLKCNCLDEGDCKIRTGECFGKQCALGWRFQGKKCNENCFFGTSKECDKPCRCWNQVACDYRTGICLNGKCARGWTGSNCQKRYDDIEIVSGTTIMEIISIVMAVILMILIFIALVIVYLKKRRAMIRKELEKMADSTYYEEDSPNFPLPTVAKREKDEKNNRPSYSQKGGGKNAGKDSEKDGEKRQKENKDNNTWMNEQLNQTAKCKDGTTAPVNSEVSRYGGIEHSPYDDFANVRKLGGSKDDKKERKDNQKARRDSQNWINEKCNQPAKRKDGTSGTTATVNDEISPCGEIEESVYEDYAVIPEHSRNVPNVGATLNQRTSQNLGIRKMISKTESIIIRSQKNSESLGSDPLKINRRRKSSIINQGNQEQPRSDSYNNSPPVKRSSQNLGLRKMISRTESIIIKKQKNSESSGSHSSKTKRRRKSGNKNEIMGKAASIINEQPENSGSFDSDPVKMNTKLKSDNNNTNPSKTRIVKTESCVYYDRSDPY